MTLERCSRETADLEELYAVFDTDRDGAEREFKYLPWDAHDTINDTREWVAEQDRRWEAAEGATYLMRANETMGVEPGTLLGITTLETEWDRRLGEQVIFMRRPFYGQGLFAESAYELLETAFCDLGIEVMVADAVEGNDRAREIFEQGVQAFGGQYDGVIRNRLPTDDGVKNVHRYTVTQRQYRETMGLVDEGTTSHADDDEETTTHADDDEETTTHADDDEDREDREEVPAVAD